MNIVLIGYRCSGKTTVGKALARMLNMRFIDTDQAVEKCSGRSIDQIVMRSGWAQFRSLEKEIISRIAEKDNLVIATGGGVVLEQENIVQLRKNGFTVWLKAPPRVIKERMAQDELQGIRRPPLKGNNPLNEINRVLAERERLYEQAADLIVDTSSSDIERVCKTIIANMELINGKGRTHGRQLYRQSL